MSSAPRPTVVPGVLLERLAQPDPARRKAALEGLQAMVQEHEAKVRLRPLPSGNDPADLARPEVRGWSWGAFLGGPLWAMAHGMIPLGVGLLFFFWLFPLANVLLGLAGGPMAWQRRRYASLEEFVRIERAWALGGIPVFAVQVGLVVGLFLFLTRGG